MLHSTTQPLWPGLSGALSALWRVASLLLGGALLIGMLLLALVVVAGLMLRAAIQGRRPASIRAGWPGSVWRRGPRTSTSPARQATGEVVDIEVREVRPEDTGPR
jgi:hypothetical protein